ncbi:MAG TPA: PAS domain S-box protein [Phototrophicaceae bacterium]|nr:PAS domain S-box protein [Phototrophicaceae bacterium]
MDKKPLNALVLDDSPSDALLLLHELRRGGFVVSHVLVDNAEDFVAALGARKWDIILSDYSMPSFNAIAALKIVRAQGFDLPFIIISGTVGEDAAVAAMKAGASDFFAKGNLKRLVPSIERELREAEVRRLQRQHEALFATIFHESPVGIAISRLSDGETLDVNSQYLETVGYSRENVVGKTRAELELWADSAQHHQLLTQLRETGLVHDTEVTYRHISGADRHVLLSAAIINQNDEPCILSMINDITQRKAAEAANRGYAERLELLHDIDRAILKGAQMQATVVSVLARLQSLTGFDSASVNTFGADFREFAVLASITPIPDYDPQEDPSIIELLKHDEAYLVDDLLNLQEVSANEQSLLRSGFRSYVLIPLIASGKLVGAFHLRALEPHAFSAQEIGITKEVGAQLAIAIENSRLLEIEQRRTGELTALHEASLQLTSSLDVKNVLDIILDYAVLLVQAHDAHLYLYDGEKLHFGVAQWGGQKRETSYSEPRPDGLTYVVARSGERQIIPDVNRHPIYQDWLWGGAIIGLPLRFGNLVIGVMSLAYRQPHEFDEHEIRVLELLADQAAIAIHNAQLYQQIRNHAAELEQRVQERTGELQASETKYRALIEFAPDPIVIVDAAGVITLTNKRAEESFGYARQELIGRGVEILLPEWLVEVHKEHRAAYLNKPTQRVMGANLELTARHKNGTEIPVKIGLSPINTGSETLVMAYIADITADKQLEASLRTALAKEKELNELKTSFTSIVSHEFRTPLAVILSSTDLLSSFGERMDQNRRQEKLTNITRQVKRLIQLLDDVLMITRSESTGFAYKPITLDLVALSEEIIDEVRMSYRQDIIIEFTPQGDCRSSQADEFLFSHILQNLASNAVKYSRAGGIVRVHLTCTPDEVRLQVQDQGIGIPVEHQSRLFQAFRRATNVGQIKGTGIGLTIVKRAVDACGGKIEFESAEGQGTTFVVTLPIVDAAENTLLNHE